MMVDICEVVVTDVRQHISYNPGYGGNMVPNIPCEW